MEFTPWLLNFSFTFKLEKATRAPVVPLSTSVHLNKVSDYVK